MRLKLTIAYFGQRYHGWQRQADVSTVQERVEESAWRVFKEPLSVQGASRTDSGVHAEGQVAHVDVQRELPLDRIASALNSRLPTDIEVRHVERAADNFDARRDACWKWYRYRVHNATARPTADWGRVWHYWREIDDSRVREAAARLVGRQDFAALASASTQPRETTVRTIYSLDVMRHYDQLIIDVTGDGFLYKMVRNIVGLVLEVGRGRYEPQAVTDMLQAGSDARARGGMPSAPPQGLTLMEIHYTPHPLAGVTSNDDGPAIPLNPGGARDTSSLPPGR